MTEARLSTIVEDDIGGAVLLLITRDTPNGPGRDLFCSDKLPVSCDDVPLDWRETERAGDAEDCGPARSMRRTEVTDRDAESVFKKRIAPCQFFADSAGRLPCEPRMGHRVIADEMSGCSDGAGNLWTLANVAADEEEAGADVVLGEHVEKELSDDIVRAIVEREGDFVWIASGYERLAEELGLR